MNYKCLLSFTFLIMIISTISIFTNPSWLKISSISMLISIFILGNILAIFYRKQLKIYCQIKNVNNIIFNIINILIHVLFPIILIILLLKNKIKNNKFIYVKSYIFSILCGVIYLFLIKLNIANSYGLNTTQILYFSISYVFLISISNWFLSYNLKI